MSSFQSRVPVSVTRQPLAGVRRTLLQNPPSAPAPAPTTATPPLVSFKDVLQSAPGLQSATLLAHIDLAPGDLCIPGDYSPARLRIKPHTHADVAFQVGLQNGKIQLQGGTMRFCKPLKITNPVNAFVEPAGLWKVGKPLVGWTTSYNITGICRDNAGRTSIEGEVHVLHGIRSRRLDAYAAAEAEKTLQRSSAAQQGPLGLSPEAAIKLLAQLSPCPVPFTLTAQGVLPKPLCVDAGGDNFIALPGGPVAVNLTGTMALGPEGALNLTIPAAGTNGVVFVTSALQAQLAATVVGTVYGQNNAYHARGSGTAELIVGRAQFEVRPKESPSEGGIQVVAGDIRRSKPLPAVVAPLQFAFQDAAITAQGEARVNAAATFLNPGDPTPVPGDETNALDLHGTMKFSVDATTPTPQIQAGGTMYMAPPGSDPFAYKVSVTPQGADFEPVTD